MNPQIWVDFNSVDDQGRVVTLEKFIERGEIFPGEIVTAGDHEGNRAKAHVAEVTAGGLVALVVDYGTFESAPELEESAV